MKMYKIVYYKKSHQAHNHCKTNLLHSEYKIADIDGVKISNRKCKLGYIALYSWINYNKVWTSKSLLENVTLNPWSLIFVTAVW